MGIRKERLHRKIADGSYDTIHLETSSDIVLLSDGSGLLEDELLKVKPIEKGGTGSNTAEEAMRSLINGCETLDEAAAGDWFFVLDKDAQTVKKISLEELKKFSGGTESPEEPVEPEDDWPDKSQLTLRNNINWAGYNWIVSHVTSTEAYLTLKGLSGSSNWYNLQDKCTTFANKFTEAQKECLKRVTAGNTSGKVFVATKDQMDGGFRYFGHYSNNTVGEWYWTSTDNDIGDGAWAVNSDGNLSIYSTSTSALGFRPSVCIDLTLYN